MRCVFQLPLTDDCGPRDAAIAFDTNLGAARREMRTFWESYVAERSLRDADATTLLERAAGHCAARLLQSAYEWSQHDAILRRSTICLVQLSFNLLRHQGRAAAVLVGEPRATTTVSA